MTRTINIALIGAAGRMGQEIIRATATHPAAKIAAAIEYPNSPLLGTDAGELAGVGSTNVTISGDLVGTASHVDVVLDVSLPAAAAGNIDTAVAAGKPLVCGITGLDDDTLQKFIEAAKTIPTIHTKNFSVGIAVLSALAAQAAAILGHTYDIEILETHHRNKADAPSGTAQILADAINDATGGHKKFTYGRHGNTGVRSDSEIGIHAIRGGGVFGDHTVVLAGENERVELTHKAETRALFAEGAVRTAVFMAQQTTPGQYTMRDVLGLN